MFLKCSVVLLLLSCVAGDCPKQKSSPTSSSPSYRSRRGEWPWHVAVFQQVGPGAPKYACGGTIIGKRFVITGRVCTESAKKEGALEAGEILVRGGVLQLTNIEDSLQQVGVEQILRQDDVALLKTVEEFEFTDYVRALPLWSGSSTEELIVGKRAVAAGWVVDDSEEESQKYAELSVVSRRNCRNSDAGLYTKQLVEKRKFCAKHLKGSFGLGSDGGGLYIADKDGKWNLRGILSSVKLEEDTLKVKDFVLFTDVTAYLPWIRKQTTNTSIADSSKCGQRSATDAGRPWRWQGQIYRNDSGSIQRLCSAAIISERFLISPAVVYNPSELNNPSQLALTFTIHENDKSQVFHSQRIGKIIRHEQFYPESGSNNIALLQLLTPLKFSERLGPVCLYRGEPREFNVELGRSGMGGFAPVDKANCDGPQNHFCVETSTPVAWNDTFYLERDGFWYLKGITANVSIDETGSRALLLDVPRYTEWIDENTVFRRKNLLENLDCAKRFINDYTFISDAAGKRCFAAHIKPTILLTTGTCLENATVAELTGTSANQTSRVKSIHVHPRFSSCNHANNIAIVQLEQPLAGVPFCLHLDAPKRKFRLRAPLPTRGFERYFYDLAPAPGGMLECAEQWRREGIDLDTSGGHLCGELEGVDGNRREGVCTEKFEGSSLYYDYGDGQGVYLRGLLDLDKRDHCGELELSEIYVDVSFYAEWIRDIVGAFVEDS